MTLVGSVGSAQALDGREAGLQAAHQALNGIGANAPGFGLVVASHQYQAREVLNGVSSLLGDAPVLGFSSPAGLTNNGQHSHAVVVAVLAGSMLQHVSNGNPSSVLQMDSMETQNNFVERSRLIPMLWLERFPAAICIPATHSNLQEIKQAWAGSRRHTCAEISAWELDTIMAGTRSAGSSA